MGEKKLHYKMYKDGKKFVFAAIATMSFFVFGGVSTVAVHADTTSGNSTAATVNSTSDTKSAVSSAATVASSASDTKSAAQSAATAASSASDTKSAAQSAATAASSASDTNSFVQLMADNATAAYNSAPIDGATSQTNSDGKTQYSSLDNAQNLSFESNTQDSSAPTATGVNLTGTYTQANLPQQFKNDRMTGDTFWLYSGADLLNRNVSITKNWANAGSINGRNVDFHETFHDFVAQNNPSANGISSITGVDTNNPYLILISSNAVDNIDVYNANLQETFWFTYSDDGSIVDITKFDQAHAAQNNNQIFYFLSASLSSNNGVGTNRREYVQTNDAKTVVISKNPINDPSTGFTAPASTMGLASVSGSNVPGGLVYTNTDPWGYQSPAGEDSNPDYYALQGGVTFANFTSNKPTLYLGAVPINASNTSWWHGNHNKNSDFLSFVTYSIDNNKKVNETINYVDQTGKTVAPIHTANPITFITVKAWDGTTTYYKFGSQEDPTLDNAGKPDSSWIQADNAKFGAIDNPTVNGYHVISTNDPDNNLSQITAKIVTKSSDNLVYKVIYAPNAEKANVTYIDDTTGKTLSTKDLTGNYGSTDPYRTSETINGYESQGYQLVSDNYPTNGVVYNQDGTVQSFEVHLTHETTPVGPNNPEKPGEPINPDNPNGPKWPDGTDKNSLTQTITRTVNYYDKQTGAVVAKQVTEQVTYNRTAIVDKVTGQIIGYSTTNGDTVDQTDGNKAWVATNNDTSWAAVTSPDLSSEGYTAPDKTVVAQTTVNPGDENASVDVYYNHVVVPVNPSNPETPGEPINPDNPNGPKWPDGTDKNSLTKTVNQTIHYQYVGGQTAAPDKTDSTTFDHQVEVDKVTGKIVKDDGWSAENDKTSFDAKVSPVIAGYTASQASSTAVTGLTQDSQDNVQTIVYAPNAETANVTYIDDTTGKTLSTKDLTGNYGSTDPYRTSETINGYESQGYQLVSDNYPTNGVVYNQDGTVQSFEVHLTHETTPVGPNNPEKPGEPINPDNPNGPKWPDGTDKNSLTQTITRTVNYYDKQTGAVVAKQVTEQVTYNRTAIVDKVTGQIIGYSTTNGDTVDQTDGNKAWVATNNDTSWAAVTSPDLSSEGYTAPDKTVVAQTTVNPGDENASVDVYYNHVVVPVNPSNPETPGEPINPDNPNGPKWPDGTDKNSLTKTVNQTIHYQYVGGQTAAPDKTDSTTFDHQVEVDKVTGKIVKDDGWSAENDKTSFDAKVSPVIAGYTASQASSTAVTGLTQDSQDNVQTIVYAPNAETANVTYIDDTTGKTLSTKDLTGNYGSTDPYRTSETINGYESQGYQLVSDNYPTNGVVYNQDGTVQSFEVHLTHETTPVGPNNPEKPGEPINPDNPNGPKWPDGTDKNSLTQTITRTVNYYDKQTGAVVAKQVTEQVTYNRTAIVDKVTGQIIGYSTTNGDTVDQTDGNKAWVATNNDTSWAAVTSPDLSSEGYTAPDKTVVAQTTVNPGDENASVDVYYNHVVVPVNPSNPETPGEPINPDNPNGPKWPDGTDKNSLTKTVNQTIHYQYVGGQTAAPDKTDSTTFDHQVEVDKVTGKIVKDDGWSAENDKTSFDAKVSPVIAGYTASQASSTAVTGLTQDSQDNVQTIVYAPNAETANVTYIDDTTGKTLSTKDLTGNYGSTDPYRTSETINGYESQGYQLVSDNYPTNGVVYNQDGTVQSFEVHLTHETTPVGPNNPEKPGEPINPDNPNGPKWPDGTDKNSLTQTITRTVNYYDKQTGAVVAKQVTEQVTYNRTAIVDKVTGQIIGYSTTNGDTVDQTDGNKAWVATNNDTSWAAVTSPDLSSEGYTAPDKTVVAQTTVNPGDENASVDVYYNHVVVPVNPSNPETPGEPINPDNPNGPKWPDGTDKNSLTKTVNQTIHYQYVGGQTAAPDKTDSTTFDHQVEVDKVTGKIVKDDGWSAENDKTSFDAKVSPVIAGYTASQASSTAVTGLTQDSQDNVQTIVYAPNAETANVTYIDDTTGKTLSTKDLSGAYGTTDPYRTNDTIAGYENAGYKLVSDNYPTSGVTYNEDSTVQSFQVHLTHSTTLTNETKIVTETIHYVYKNGTSAHVDYQAKPLIFTRTVTTDNVTGAKVYGSWTADQSFAAVTSPTIKGYTPDQAEIGSQTVSGDSSDLDFTVVYAKNAPTITTESKTINETIHYVYKDGTTAHDDYVAKPVEFTRQVSTDAVTGEKTYGPWSAAQSFDAVKSPELKGYTADKAQIDKQTVNGDSKDLAFTVTYTKNAPVAGGNVTAKYVDENGNSIADDVIASGNVGDPYSTTQKDVPGYTFKEVQGNPTGSFTDQDQTVTYVYTKNPATDNNGGTGLNQPGKPGNGTDTGNSSSNQPGNPSQPSNATNNGVINTSTNTGSKVNNSAVNSPELPQTGENNSQSQTMSFIGILLAMFGSSLGFLGIKKRRND